jgi:hypothetical protein
VTQPQWLTEELGLTPEEVIAIGQTCKDCPGGLMCCMAERDDDD